MRELLLNGIELAVFGMTAVFVLLGCLVLAMKAMSRLAAALEPARIDPDPTPLISGFDDRDLTAAVTAAIHAYRRRKGR